MEVEYLRNTIITEYSLSRITSIAFLIKLSNVIYFKLHMTNMKFLAYY